MADTGGRKQKGSKCISRSARNKHKGIYAKQRGRTEANKERRILRERTKSKNYTAPGWTFRENGRPYRIA